VCIYYFSKGQQRAVATYLGLLKVERNDPNVLAKSITDALTEWELNGSNMVAIIADGVSEVCPDLDGLIALLKPTCPNVLNLRSTFSSLSQAFHAAVKKALPPCVEFMLRESYNWFADSLERQHRHKAILEQVGFIKKNDESDEDRRRREQAEEVAEQGSRVHRTRRYRQENFFFSEINHWFMD